MCQSGGRAGWVKAALDSLGYENVYNITGWGVYDGDNVVLGDGSYALDADVYGMYTPGTYVAADEDHGYFVTVIINDNGGIQDVLFDAVYGVFVECLVDGTADTTIDSRSCKPVDDDDTKTYVAVKNYLTKQILGDSYGMRTDAGLTWAEMADMFADVIVSNQGWDAAWVINAGTDGGHDYFDLNEVDDVETTEVDETYAGDPDTVDAVAGVTAGIEGFKVAWDLAIALATPAN
jgi:hypothetical protein